MNYPLYFTFELSNKILIYSINGFIYISIIGFTPLFLSILETNGVGERSPIRSNTKQGITTRQKRSKNANHHRDCPPIVDENIEIDIIKQGKNRVMHSRGSALKVSCKPGYSLNLAKKKIRCRKGNWLPGTPECLPLGCKLPRLPNEEGTFKSEGVILPIDGKRVDHGKEVDLECDDGYFRNGPARLRCWFGEWSAGSSTGFGMPKCVGNPCELPVIIGQGMYSNKIGVGGG